MMDKSNNLWCWGYILKETRPVQMEFLDRPTWCSLETAAEFVGADNVVFMDSTSDIERLNEQVFGHLSGVKNVICGLQHGKECLSATKISEFSLHHPTIIGAVIDDFLDEVGPSKDMNPDDLRQIYQALKSQNPALKLYVVRYSRQNKAEVLPFLPYFDGVMFWCWVSTDHYWRYQYHQDLVDMRRLYGKEVIQGIFIHDYGDSNQAQPMDMLSLQVPRIGKELRTDWIDGIVLLQNGWFDAEDHREQMMYLKHYFTWYYGTKSLN